MNRKYSNVCFCRRYRKMLKFLSEEIYKGLSQQEQFTKLEEFLLSLN